MSEWRENQAQRSSGNNYDQPKTAQVETISFSTSSKVMCWKLWYTVGLATF